MASMVPTLVRKVTSGRCETFSYPRGVLQPALAASATLIAIAFALSTYERWQRAHRAHELAWTAAFALFALASVALWVGASSGWTSLWFRLFYLFGAIVDVPVLAVGTVYLLGRRRTGDVTAAGVAMASAFAAGVLAMAPLTHPVPAHRLPKGSEVFGPLPRILAAVASAGGALVVLGGAVWSAWRYRRGRMVLANASIALGTLVLGAGGLLNSTLGEMGAFAVSLAVGIALIFVGFLGSLRPVGAGGPSRPDLVGASSRR